MCTEKTPSSDCWKLADSNDELGNSADNCFYVGTRQWAAPAVTRGRGVGAQVVAGVATLVIWEFGTSVLGAIFSSVASAQTSELAVLLLAFLT